MIGTIILWILAIIGVIALSLWTYAWVINPEKEIKELKKTQLKSRKKTKNKKYGNKSQGNNK